MLTPHPSWHGYAVPRSRPKSWPEIEWVARSSVWERRTALLLFAVTALRLVIISTTGLSDTEAYYFTWSRFPDWSYYDHPPLIAWLMSATTMGSTSPFFVRIGSVVCSGLFGF